MKIPINACIYCGKPAIEDRLTNEHIVPYGLGGRNQLLKASCSECSKITSAFEGKALHRILGDIRFAADYPSRRRRKRRGETRRLTINNQEYHLSSRQYPVTSILPVFEEPGYCSGAIRQGKAPLVGYAAIADAERLTSLINMSSTYKGIVTTSATWDYASLRSFALMLAKIAYASVVLKKRSIIQENTYISNTLTTYHDNIFYYVGSVHPNTSDDQLPYEIVKPVTAIGQIGDNHRVSLIRHGHYWIVYIRILLRHFNRASPIYKIIII